MKRIIIATSLLATTLLLLAPSIPYLQYSTIVTANTTEQIRQFHTVEKTQITEQLRSIDFPRLKESLHNNSVHEMRQKIKERFNTNYQGLPDKFLKILLLCALVAYVVSYSIGGSIGYTIDTILYLLTQGEWEFLTATTIMLLPSEFFFWIILTIIEIGMNRYGWPFPDNPGIHLSQRKPYEPVISQRCS